MLYVVIAAMVAVAGAGVWWMLRAAYRASAAYMIDLDEWF